MTVKSDAIAAAELAALIGSELHEVDSKRLDGDNAVKMHPRDFLPAATAPVAQTTNQRVIPQAAMVEVPKSKPAGSQVVGVEDVNIGKLMIPMDGADAKMREAIAAYSAPPGAPAPAPAPAPVQQASVATPPPAPQESEAIFLLKEINRKLDLILKRAKIQPRYKKK